MVTLLLLYLKVNKPKIKKFREWSALERIAGEINKAVENDITKFPGLTCRYISTALCLPLFIVEKLPWSFCIDLYYLSLSVNSPTKIPILVSSSEKHSSEDNLSWDYDGRSWMYWSHLLAHSYGWKLEYIANLEVDTALAHIQEILTEEQLEKEFTWSTTEIAYPYNSTTKVSKFSPLERPYWMHEKARPVKKFKIAKNLMPVGIVNDISGMAAQLEKETKSPATKSE